MRCPYCREDDDKVIDSRVTDDGTAIRRRRQCNACGERFTTYERVESEEHVRVTKADGSSQMFDRKKVLRGLQTACEKRPITVEQLEVTANEVLQEIVSRGLREVSTKEIGQLVMNRLNKLDQVAYVRFASVYRQFKDLDDFMAELKKVLSGAGDATDSNHQA